ncbi:MAG: GNAT family N-acetyltransferase [Anaerolineae bacterium]|nr:GNAT family N-acetyltransferase [Anaerolineae bacterium]
MTQQTTITLSHDPARLAALQAEWQALQARSSCSIYLTWDWITAWWAHCGPPAELWLLEARAADGRLVGLAPLMRADYSPLRGITWRQLQFIGSDAAFDHLGFLVEEGRAADVIPQFMAALQAARDRWDVLFLSDLAAGDPALDVLLAQDIPWRAEETLPCPAIALPDRWEDFHDALSKRKRKNIRRAHRALDEAYPGGWRAEEVTDPDDIDRTMAEMIRLHQAKWEALGMPGGFADPRVAVFHRANAQALAAQGRLWLFRLWIGEAVAAIEYAYAWQGRVYAFASGVNFDLAEYSPGQMLMEHMIQTAIERGMHTYDFLRGDEDYKFFWQAEPREDHHLRWLAASRARREQQMIDLLGETWQRAKRLLPAGLRQQLRQAAGHPVE